MNSGLLLIGAVVTLLVLIYSLNRIKNASLHTLIMAIIGGIVGLLIGALLSVPLGRLPGIYGNVLPIVATVISAVIFIRLFLYQLDTVMSLLPFLQNIKMGGGVRQTITSGDVRILVDTSVIIDGRIADIAKAGFIPGKLLIPRFVLAELQNIADSDDNMRRTRGRRGLEILNNLRKDADISVEIIDDDPTEIAEVDAKLVHLAKQINTNILTTDYNLNRVAQIEGVKVLNINELSNAIRPVVLPGEEMAVKIVQAGKEKGQGVGYLSDGTMIVVEQGDKLIGQEVLTEVTRIFQTVAGKMIFTSLKAINGPGHKKSGRKKEKV